MKVPDEQKERKDSFEVNFRPKKELKPKKSPEEKLKKRIQRMKQILFRMPRSRLAGLSYNPKMPNLVKVNEMTLDRKLRLLGTYHRSVYCGESESQIAKQLSKNQLHRYATELVLLNMISKSDFEDISDKGSDECESQHSRENISQCSQECEIRIGRNDQAREHCEIEMNNFEN